MEDEKKNDQFGSSLVKESSPSKQPLASEKSSTASNGISFGFDKGFGGINGFGTIAQPEYLSGNDAFGFSEKFGGDHYSSRLPQNTDPASFSSAPAPPSSAAGLSTFGLPSTPAKPKVEEAPITKATPGSSLMNGGPSPIKVTPVTPIVNGEPLSVKSTPAAAPNTMPVQSTPVASSVKATPATNVSSVASIPFAKETPNTSIPTIKDTPAKESIMEKTPRRPSIDESWINVEMKDLEKAKAEEAKSTKETPKKPAADNGHGKGSATPKEVKDTKEISEKAKTPKTPKTSQVSSTNGTPRSSGRLRKSVDRLSPSALEVRTDHRPLDIPNGAGIKLGDIAHGKTLILMH